MATIRIKSEHPESQGEFVVIEEENFDGDIHELYDGSDEAPTGRGGWTIPQLKAGLDELGIDYSGVTKKAALLALYPEDQE